MSRPIRFGEIGFVLALVALGGLFLFTRSDAAKFLVFLAVPAAIFSGIGLIAPPRRWAGWGLAISLFVCLYLPTIFAVNAW
jgi:hypothetical protein